VRGILAEQLKDLYELLLAKGCIGVQDAE